MINAKIIIGQYRPGFRRNFRYRLISIQRFLKSTRLYKTNCLKRSNQLQILYDVLLFIVLILSFHFLYLFWSRGGFYPLGAFVKQFFSLASHHLFLQSKVMLDLTGIEYTTREQTFYITNILGSTSWVEVSPACTSLKQWLHWVFLMILFPGPWRHKLWYIPIGLVIIQGISILRITGLACAVYRWPGSFPFFHDYVFKGLFYGTIFLMWVIWTEFLRKKHR